MEEEDDEFRLHVRDVDGSDLVLALDTQSDLNLLSDRARADPFVASSIEESGSANVRVVGFNAGVGGVESIFKEQITLKAPWPGGKQHRLRFFTGSSIARFGSSPASSGTSGADIILGKKWMRTVLRQKCGIPEGVPIARFLIETPEADNASTAYRFMSTPSSFVIFFAKIFSASNLVFRGIDFADDHDGLPTS